MTNLQKIQQETDDRLRNEWRKEIKKWPEMDALASADWWIEKSHSCELIAYKAGYDEGMSDEVENCPHTKNEK